MPEYSNNSYKHKEEAKETERKIEPVAKGVAKQKNGAHRFADVFISDDVRNVKSYFVTEVLVPGIQRIIYNGVTGALEMIFPSLGVHKKVDSDNGYRTNYSGYYKNQSPKHPQMYRTNEYDEVVVNTRGEAELVLDNMNEILSKYKMVRVADYYDLLEYEHDHTANNYCWTDLRDARIVRCSDGYMISLPKPMPID